MTIEKNKEYRYVDHLQVNIGQCLNETKEVKETVVMIEINDEVYIFGIDELKTLQDINFTQNFQNAIDEALRLESMRIN